MVKGTKREILKRIGNSMRGLRLQANITQQMLAERCGVSHNAIRADVSHIRQRSVDPRP